MISATEKKCSRVSNIREQRVGGQLAVFYKVFRWVLLRWRYLGKGLRQVYVQTVWVSGEELDY